MQVSDIPFLNTSSALGLYIHIPFCERKCDYCDFYSVPKADTSVIRKVLDATLEELYFFLQRLGDVQIDTIYIGGGTPSIIERSILASFMCKLKCSLSANIKEWTIEANPQSIDLEFLRICKTYGINRISLGVQSLDRFALSSIGRNADASENYAAIKLLSHAWDKDLNIDLLAGLPGQDRHAIIDGIRFCIDNLEPGHISFYSLKLEEGTTLADKVRTGICKLPRESQQDDLWLSGRTYLEEFGYGHYEISNFAKPGKECLHNLKYWHMEPYIGIGASSVSTLPDGRGGVIRIENPKDLDAFLAGAQNEWGMISEYISPKDFMFENIMMGFRLKEGINRKTFRSRFGTSLEEILGRLWPEWSEKNYIECATDAIALTTRARLVLNPILRELYAHLDSLPDGMFPKYISWPEE